MIRARATVALCALPLLGFAGCGAQQAPTADAFEGDQKPVAQVVVDLADAAGKGDAATICSRILAGSLVDKLAAKGSNCTAEVKQTLGDADQLQLEVRKVQVVGDRAAVTVRDGDGREAPIGLVRESGGWRLNAL